MAELTTDPPSAEEFALYKLRCRETHDAIVATLIKLRGQDLAMDVRDCDTVDAPLFELLIAIAKTWRADGRQFKLTAVPSDFIPTAIALGVEMQEIGLQGHLDEDYSYR